MKAQNRLAYAAVALAVLGAACGDDDATGPGPLPASASYQGTYGDPMNVGTLSITFVSPVAHVMGGRGGAVRSPAAPITAAATLELSGAGSISLTGSVDNGVLTLSGGGYTLSGALNGGKAGGSSTGPNGDGVFQALSSPAGAEASIICGHYEGTLPDDEPDTGNFYMVASGGVLAIVYHSDGGDNGGFVGTIDAENTINARATASDPDIGNVTLTVSGDINEDRTAALGVYSLTGGGATWGGEWAGSTAACGA
ncbi:MAG TPA: hypothetical protein VFM23_03585 [Gemmatimonadales bacterium]|nr:hypothetical protein [Gemmatimonadales bacterium]